MSKRYMIKISSNSIKGKEYTNLKIFKKKNISNNKTNNMIKHLGVDSQKKTIINNRQDISFIPNRYNAHKFIEFLHEEVEGERKKYSYTVQYNDIEVNERDKTYERCSQVSAHIILRTECDINRKVNEINKEYAKNINPEARFIKEIKNQEEEANKEIYFKRISPVVIKSTVSQIKNCENSFYQGIYKNNDVEKQIENAYPNVGGKQKNAKNIYILPKLLEKYKKENSPTVFISDDDYINMMLKSIREERKAEKNYKISSGRGISVIKLNKPKKNKEYFFNVIGAAFKFETDDKDVINKMVSIGCGHITGYGFGYAYTLDESKKYNKDLNKKRLIES